MPLAHDSAVAVAAGRGEVVDAEDRERGPRDPKRCAKRSGAALVTALGTVTRPKNSAVALCALPI